MKKDFPLRVNDPVANSQRLRFEENPCGTGAHGMTEDTHYVFRTRWEIPAPLEHVWQELMRPDEWPLWWRGVEQVQLLQPAADPLGVGAERRYTWRSRLPYRLSFTIVTTLVEPMSRIEGIASGELAGRGAWRLTHSHGITHVDYDWNVEVTRWWMRRLSWIARPLFVWNHDVVMEWGRQGLLRRLTAIAPPKGKSCES